MLSREQLLDLDAYLTSIEERNDSTIAAAWVTGSHSWGTASPDSDIDIRFVFTQPMPYYASQTRYLKAIDVAGDDLADGVPYAAQMDCDIEFLGWNIQRFMELLGDRERGNNPAAIEALSSPYTIRAHHVIAELREYIDERFNVIELYDHYQGLAKKQYRRYIVEGDEPTVKRTIYIARAALFGEYIRHEHSLPTLSLSDFLNDAPEEVFADWERDSVRELLELKREGRGDKHIGNRFGEQAEAFIERDLDYERHIPEESIDKGDLDTFTFRLLESRYGEPDTRREW